MCLLDIFEIVVVMCCYVCRGAQAVLDVQIIGGSTGGDFRSAEDAEALVLVKACLTQEIEQRKDKDE